MPPRPKLDRYTRQPGVEPIPGYRLLAPLGRGAYGEVWKCRAPGGLEKALKIVGATRSGAANSDDTRSVRGPGGAESSQVDPRALVFQEHQALDRIKSIRHPFLLSIERVELIGGELLVVMELADQS